MWFIGLVFGLLFGAGIGGGGGALLGAIVGGLLGSTLSQRRRSKEERIETLEQLLKDVQARVGHLERRIAALSVAPQPSARAEAPAAAAPEPQPAAPARPEPSAPERPEPSALPPSPPSPAARAAAPMTPAVELEDLWLLAQREHTAHAASEMPSAAPAIGPLLDEALRAAKHEAAPAHDTPAAQPAARDDESVPPTSVAAPEPQRAVFSHQPEPEPSPPPRRPRASEPVAPIEIEPGTLHALWMRLISGNIVAKMGVLILFLGVGFLLKYAYEHTVIPVPLRLAGVAAAGFAMIYGGWRLVPRRRLYGLIVQGGGVGLLYLDVYFALKVYDLIGAASGFTAFMLLGVAATLLAVRQDARVLAVLGLIGAFLAPILAGSKTGSHVMLFSYYALLNGFILAISWFKAWRDLNLVGFVFTFVVGAIWGANNYRPELFASVEPFLLVFFSMYLIIPILFAQRQPPDLKGLVDGTLVFGTPLCVAFMQARLVHDLPYGLAWSAFVGSVLYALLAWLTIRREGMRLLGETYVALAVVLVTLGIFFAFDAYPTFALWTLEGAAIIWVGLRQRRLLARLFGFALQIAGTIYFLKSYRSYDLANPFWNELVLGCAVIAVAGFIIARLLEIHRDRKADIEPSPQIMLVWALGWWTIGGAHAFYHAYSWGGFTMALLAFIALTMVAVELAGTRLEWMDLRKLAFAHLPALAAIAFMIAFGGEGRLQFVRPLAEGGWWAWPLSFLVLFWTYARHVRDGLIADSNVVYSLAWLFAAAIGSWDVAWLLEHRLYAQAMVWGAATLLAACIRFRLRERDNPGAIGIAVPALLWALAVWFVSGSAWMHATLPVPVRPMAILAYFAASCIAFELLGTFVQWRALRRAATLLVVGMVVSLLVQVEHAAHPFAGYGWAAWPAAVALLFVVLRRHESDDMALLAPAQHLAAFWIALIALTWEAAWQLDALGFGRPWIVATCGVVPALASAFVARFEGREAWPFGTHYSAVYRDWALGPVAFYLIAWTVYANVYAPGDMRPLPYVPLLNPLDIATAVALWTGWRWAQAWEAAEEPMSVRLPLFGALAFFFANCVMLRTVHYWGGVDYELVALSQSTLVQSGFSLLWTGTACVLMLYATRSARRSLWMVGAALLGAVVLKLFVSDLANTGTIARIVSFIGVGAGLLLIGYVAPVPPGETERQAD